MGCDRLVEVLDHDAEAERIAVDDGGRPTATVEVTHALLAGGAYLLLRSRVAKKVLPFGFGAGDFLAPIAAVTSTTLSAPTSAATAR